jgi:hypothetical protein
MPNTEMKMRESELLDKLICDYGPTKYVDIVWAMEWARCLRSREEYRQLPMAEMIEKAMLEVISGQVTSEQILATIYGTPASGKTEAAAPATDKKEEKKPAAKAADKTEKKADKAEKKTEKAEKMTDKAEKKEEPKKAKKEKTKKD